MVCSLVGWKRKSVEPPQDRIDVCALKQKNDLPRSGKSAVTDVQHSSMAMKAPRAPLISNRVPWKAVLQQRSFQMNWEYPYNAFTKHLILIGRDSAPGP